MGEDIELVDMRKEEYNSSSFRGKKMAPLISVRLERIIAEWTAADSEYNPISSMRSSPHITSSSFGSKRRF